MTSRHCASAPHDSISPVQKSRPAASGSRFRNLGNVGRNVLRGPRQANADVSVVKHFRGGEAVKGVELRAEFFNLFNLVNYANPISDLGAVTSSGGRLEPETGRIIDPGDFGRVISTSNNPRIVQLVLKFNY